MLYDFEYSSEKLDCGNVVNIPYWLHVTCSRVLWVYWLIFEHSEKASRNTITFPV